MATIIAISSVDPGCTWYLHEKTESDLGPLEKNQGVTVKLHDGEGQTCVTLEGDASETKYIISSDAKVTRNPHFDKLEV